MERRIKRQILGKPHWFYVSTLPGFERLCADELAKLGVAFNNVQISQGGIEFSAKVHQCWQANLHLRIANRILMRIDTFKATNFRRLGEKAENISWELYLYPGVHPEIHVTSHRSRLIHTGAITDQVAENIAKRMSTASLDNPPATGLSKYPQQIFIRASDDRFTISIDTSGELLHKRGLKIRVGRAPLRETLAAAILYIAGYDPKLPLVDPMCGSGTFSLEGAMMAGHIPPGWYRDFAFMGWPGFKMSRWRHIRREAEKSMFQIDAPLIFASDKDLNACRELEAVIQKYNLSGTVSVRCQDFFDMLPPDAALTADGEQKGLVVINPPYGRRMAERDASNQIFEEMCRKLKKDFRGWKFALIAPNKALAGKAPFKASRHEMFHGGLKVILLVGRID